MIRILGIAALVLLLPLTAAKAGDDAWLHVAVDGAADDPERVRINVPLSLVEAILPLVEVDEFCDGSVRIDDEEFRPEDLRKMLDALEKAEDGQYVSIEDYEDTVKISKEKGKILVHVREDGGRGDRVDVRIPLAVVEALLSGDEDELDILAAVRAIAAQDHGDLVTVTDDEENVVRIWVDDRNTSD